MADATSYSEAEAGGFTLSTTNDLALKLAAAMLPISDTVWEDVKNSITGTIIGSPVIGEDATGRYVDFGDVDQIIDMGQSYLATVWPGPVTDGHSSSYIIAEAAADPGGTLPYTLFAEHDDSSRDFHFRMALGVNYLQAGSGTRTIVNTLTAGTVYGLGHSSPGDGNIQGYRDGSPADSGPEGGFSNTNINFSVGARWGVYPAVSGAYVGRIYLLLLSNESLTSTEHETLHGNPWQVFEAGSGQTIAVAQVTESSLAQAMGRAKQTVVAAIAETDSAFAVQSAKTQALGLIAESDLSQALTAAKSQSAGQATETGTAFATGSRKTVSLALVTEADLAQAVQAETGRIVSQVMEEDAAQVLTAARAFGVAQVLESDVAFALASAKRKALGLIAGIDTAHAIASRKTVSLALVVESDLSQSMITRTTRTIAQVAETDTAFDLGRSKQAALGLISESDSAFPIGVQRVFDVLAAAESSTAFALTVAKLETLGLVTESDIAFALTVVGANAVNKPGITSGSPARAMVSASLARGITSASPARGITKH